MSNPLIVPEAPPPRVKLPDLTHKLMNAPLISGRRVPQSALLRPAHAAYRSTGEAGDCARSDPDRGGLQPALANCQQAQRQEDWAERHPATESLLISINQAQTLDRDRTRGPLGPRLPIPGRSIRHRLG